MGRERTRSVGDAGSVLVEAAMVITLLFVVAGGIADVSAGWAVRAQLEHAALAMARSAAGNDGRAESDVNLLALAVALDARSGIEVQRVIVFRAGAGGGVDGQPCGELVAVTGAPLGVVGVCNVYGPVHLAEVAAGNVYPDCPAVSPQSSWCPTTRRRERPGADHLGVFVEVASRTPLGLVGGNRQQVVSASAVVLMDPVES